MADTSVIWRRLDLPGHEAARLSRRGPGWELAGKAVFASDGQPCGLEYSVMCGPDWRTISARVTGWIGSSSVEVDMEATAGQWRLNGVDCPQVAGCVDLDLSFSPSTNLLPIRRLDLAIGAQASFRAAWLRFPNLDLEPLDQLYRRTSDTTYRYESDRGAFVTDLKVNGAGFVTDYPGLWRIEESG